MHTLKNQMVSECTNTVSSAGDLGKNKNSKKSRGHQLGGEDVSVWCDRAERKEQSEWIPTASWLAEVTSPIPTAQVPPWRVYTADPISLSLLWPSWYFLSVLDESDCRKAMCKSYLPRIPLLPCIMKSYLLIIDLQQHNTTIKLQAH